MADKEKIIVNRQQVIMKVQTPSLSVSTIEELLLIEGEENAVVVVTDENRGGTFVYRSAESGVNNGGTVFNGWCRQYDGAVNVKWFGAKGDGVTDDTDAIQNAINTENYTVLTPDKTYLIKNLTSANNGGLACIDGRATLRVADGVSNKGLSIITDNFTLDGVNFDGGSTELWYDNLTPIGTRKGIVVGNVFGTAGTGRSGITIKNCDVYGFDRFGIEGIQVNVGFNFGKRVVYENVNSRNNFINWYIGERHEYCTFTNCYGYKGNYGLQMTGGNNSFVACHFEWNYINALLGTGENDSHGQFIGCSFNHSNTTTAGNLGLKCSSIKNGHVFLGCAFWYAPITLVDSSGIMITKSQIVKSPITISSGGINNIDDNYTHEEPLNITLNNFTFTTFRRNRTKLATSTAQSPHYGDLFVYANESTYSYPIAWNSATDTTIPLSNMTLKYNSVTQSFLHNGSKGIAPVSGNYLFDVSITLDTTLAARAVLKLVTERDGTIYKTFISSNDFASSRTECTLRLSQQIFLTTGDKYYITLNSLGTTISIPTDGINFTVKSLDN